MRVIARIPDLSAPEVPAGVAAPDARPSSGPRPRPGRGAAARRNRPWPTWPVAALTLVVILTWVLATWNDHARLRKQRGDARMAREPAASGPVHPAAVPGGAVVR